MQGKVGFAGIGLMGLPMCKRLLQAGVELWVWNRNPEKCAPLVALGAKQAQTPRALAEHVSIVMTCLADTAAVAEVVFGAEGIAMGLSATDVLVDFSSAEPQATRQMAERLFSQCQAHWVDAPVSGGTLGAEEGSLAIMAGGRVEDIERLRPLLMHLGQRLTRMGEVGAGQVTKVCNQMIVACNALVIAEVVALAERSGVAAELLAPALAGGFADSKPFQILAPQMAERSFEPIKWHVRTLLKDLNTAVQVAADAQAGIPMTNQAAMLMDAHARAGFAAKDPATLVLMHAKEV